MQQIRLFAAIAALTPAALCQVNPFVFYPQDPERQTITCTSFVGRPDVSNAAEALMQIDWAHFRGVGDANGLTFLFGVYHWLADEKLSTSETYSIVVRNSTPAGTPDMSTAAEFVRIGGLTSPPSTNPNRGTWIMSDGFGALAPVTVSAGFTPQPQHYFVGVDLPANPLWPATDGHGLFRADLLNANAGVTPVGENHRAGAPDPTWAGLHTAPPFSTKWTYILGPFVTSPNLHIGGIDPTSNRLGAPGATLSMNGLVPDISGTPRRDGLMLRITDNIAPFGLVFLGASPGFQPPYYEWALQGTLIGHSFTGGPTTIPLGLTTLQVGARDVSIAAPNTLSPSLVGADFVFQAIVWDIASNIAEWTNAQAVHL